MDVFPKFVAAAVQAAPVFLDREQTTRKACALVREAAAHGAQLVVFPEVFLPGYPYWNWTETPFEGSRWFRELYSQSVDVPGRETAALAEVARDTQTYVVMGLNERDPVSLGTLYNTNVIFGPDGSLLGRHRKLVPTWAEKLTWTGGDGSSLRVYDTSVGPLGTLACGENTNTLARYSLLAQGELVHAANFPAFPFVDDYDMPGAIQIRVGAHAFEGKVFCVVACSTMTPEIVERLGDTDDKRRMLSGSPNACSCIFGPDGRPLSEPLIDVEGIVYGEIDLARCLELRQMHNITGSYNRFDIFTLTVDRRPQTPIGLRTSKAPVGGGPGHDGAFAEETGDRPARTDAAAGCTDLGR